MLFRHLQAGSAILADFAYILVFDSDSKGEKSWKLKKTPALNTQKVSLTDLQPYTHSNLKNMNSLFLHKTAKRQLMQQKKLIFSESKFTERMFSFADLSKSAAAAKMTVCNVNAERYVLTEEQILDCCREGYALGFRTFVLQGGEGMLPVEKICRTVKKIRSCFPDCAITLSLGEYPRSEYLKMFESGADRYLLRHETADSVHYR